MKRLFVPRRARFASVAFAMLLFAGVDRAEAGCGCGACASGPSYHTVQRTVLVSQMVPETRIVNTTVCVPQTHERNVTVYRQVPETKQVTENYTVMVPQRQTRTQKYTVSKPVYSDVEQTYTISVPTTEARTGTRSVCRPVQVQEMRTVTKDLGHWEEVVGPSPVVQKDGGVVVQKGTVGAAQKGEVVVQKGGTVVQKSAARVWRSKIVTEQHPVTVTRNQWVQEEYTYNVCVYRPQTQTRMVRVCNYVQETKSHDVTYTVLVPQKQSRTRNLTTYKTVAEQKTQQYTVMVPQTVQKEVTVMVCRTVPQVVTQRVPVCATPVYAPACRGCGSCRRCCR